MPFSAKALTMRSVVSCACAPTAATPSTAATTDWRASLLIAFMDCAPVRVKGPPMLAPAALGPALNADQRHEHHAAEIARTKAAVVVARQLHQCRAPKPLPG